MRPTIRNFRAGDERGILDAWNAAMPNDPIDLEVFIRKVLCDPNFDEETVFIAEDGGEATGFLIAYMRKTPMYGSDLEPDTGWIAAFGVKPEHRNRGVGTALFEAAFERFAAAGRRQVHFAPYTPGYFYAGVDEAEYPAARPFMERLGFRAVEECVGMDIDLAAYRPPEDLTGREKALIEEGYAFEELSAPYVYPLFLFHLTNFTTDWRRVYAEAIANGLPFRQIFIARKGGEIVGSSIYGAVDRNYERFGPFGVSAGERGKGVGKILLHRALQSMKRRGFHCAYLLWTEENEPAGFLYKKTGFRVTRRFSIMTKSL